MLDTESGTATPVSSAGVLNGRLTRILSRPATGEFAAVGPLGVADTIRLNRLGFLSYAGEPDFTVQWGGQDLPWIAGSGGNTFAVTRAMLWQAQWAAFCIWARACTRAACGERPGHLLHTRGLSRLCDTGIAGKTGEFLHIVICGLPAEDVADGSSFRVTLFTTPNVGNGLRNPYMVPLELIGASATPYHPYVSQLTIRIPERGAGNVGDLQVGSLELNIRLRVGSRSGSNWYGYLRY